MSVMPFEQPVPYHYGQLPNHRLPHNSNHTVAKGLTRRKKSTGNLLTTKSKHKKSRPHHRVKMETSNADEMEQFQRLSDQYQPDVPGPLVGDKQSITELVREYDLADPTYITKTTALAASYPTYRKIKGDGQCGWRGATFGYFEILIMANDPTLLVQEEIRIRSFEDTMKMAGVDYELMEDMFEPTWDLFTALRKSSENSQQSHVILLDFFNDEIRSNSIVYHFKMMTSSYMQLRPDDYEPFLEMSIQEYRVSRIDPTNQEIDQIGLQALTDGVIAPARIGVNVLYLDRSMGDEVTPHVFVRDSESWPSIWLLYRPGHYDLIYKDHQPIRVMLQLGETRAQNFSEVSMSNDPYMEAYVYSNIGSGQHGQIPQYPNDGYYPPNNYQYQYYPEQPGFDTDHGVQNFPYNAESLQSPPAQYHHPPIPPPQASLPHYQVSTPSPKMTTPRSLSTPSLQDSAIRLSIQTHQYSLQRHGSIPLDQNSYGSSTLNQAHFRNADFQPEMWNAGSEYNKP